MEKTEESAADSFEAWLSLLPEADRRWVEQDQVLWRQARELAASSCYEVNDFYRTLKNLQRTPEERLRLGLRHGRLHPQRR